MIRFIMKGTGVLLLSEFVVFIAMVVVNMTDRNPPVTGRIFYWLLKYVFSFPIFLINNEFPFFLDSKIIPFYSLLLILLNNIILVIFIIIIKRIFK